MSTNSSPPLSPLYARYLTHAEKIAIRHSPVGDLSSEINLVRLLLSHFLKFQQSAPGDMPSRRQALLTCTFMCGQLAALVRVQDQIHSPVSELDECLYEALAGLPAFAEEPDEKEPLCPKNAVVSPATGTPGSTDFMQNTSAPLRSSPSRISPSPP